jgi:hypothetical protein
MKDQLVRRFSKNELDPRSYLFVDHLGYYEE